MHAGTFAEEAFRTLSHFCGPRTLCQMMPRMHTVHVMRSPVVLGLFLRDIVDPGLGDHGIMRGVHAGLSRAEGKFLVNRDEAVGRFSVERKLILTA